MLLIHIYVPDVDKTFEKAIRKGCRSVQPPVINGVEDTDKRGMFVDFAGNTWAVSTAMEF